MRVTGRFLGAKPGMLREETVVLRSPLTCRCCHSSRDARCGTLGEPLARRLADAAHEAGLSDSVQVFRCSHIGGHKVRSYVEWGCHIHLLNGYSLLSFPLIKLWAALFHVVPG